MATPNLEKLIQNCRLLEKNAATNTSEPLAAHSILPILGELVEFIRVKEHNQLPPQVGYLSIPLLMAIREFFKDAAFNALYDEYISGNTEDEDNKKVKILFLSLEAEVQRSDIETVSAYWMNEFGKMIAQIEEQESAKEGEATDETVQAPQILVPTVGGNSNGQA